MSWLLWQAQGNTRIASTRLVLRAAEVPLLRQAQQLCDELAEMQRQEAQRIAAVLETARAEGQAQGLEDGRRDAREELSAGLMQLGLAAERERERLRRDTGVLALQVVRKLLGRFNSDELLAALAETAAAEVVPAQPLVLAVHADQADAVRARLVARGIPAAQIEVRGDATCAPDTCRLDSGHGCMDASLEGQLARLEQAWAPRGQEAA
jgi:flagellar biosynthesis/type III secretory pathway protein FliH